MGKQLYFLRHAIAVPRGTEGVREEERPLTEAGREKIKKAAKGIRRLGVPIEAILSSPLTRAYQTAEIVAETLPTAPEIEIEAELSPDGDLQKFLKKIKKRPETSFLLTGHEPSLSSWIEDLLGCERTASILMRKGALCHLEVDLYETPPHARMIFLLQPKILRRLGSQG